MTGRKEGSKARYTSREKKNHALTLRKQLQLGQEMKGCAPRIHNSIQNYIELWAQKSQ